jgi:hypothetical protein
MAPLCHVHHLPRAKKELGRTMSEVAPFTKENINQFAAAWYLALDNHAPSEELCRLLSDDVQMVFPEKTLPGIADFRAWYAGGRYSDGEEAPGVINIFFDENHNVVSVDVTSSSGNQVEVKVVVAWQASWFVKPSTKAKRTSLDATQTWTLARSDKNGYGLAISRYNAVAAPFEYAPGFARL